MERKTKLICLLTILSGCIFGITYLTSLLLLPQPTFFTEEELELYSFEDEPILVVIPLLTANAYSSPGFYDFYKGNCGTECLTIKINEAPTYNYQSSNNLIRIFQMLKADSVSDYYLIDHMNILAGYKTIVILHNEYVTKELFVALQNHPNVIYLYPNALYAEIEVNDRKMTLIRGHSYPQPEISNGFDWQHDNSKLEYDFECDNYKWIKIPNGYQLSCYPEKQILNHKEIFNFIKICQEDCIIVKNIKEFSNE